MKRSMIAGLVIVIGLLLTSAVYAWWAGYGTGTNIENVKKFQKETLSLRDDLMTKQFELQNEYNKPVPDTNRIATLRKEIIDLQAKIQAVAEKYGISAWGPGYGMGPGMMGPGMRGHGMMMGPGMMDMCPWGW